MSLFGSRDLELANPPECLTEDAPCLCGHSLEDHEGSYHPGRCLWVPDPRSDQYDSNPCDCDRFELDER